MNFRPLALPLVAASFLLVAGCAEKNTVRPVEAPVAQVTSAHVAASPVAAPKGDVHVADDIAHACMIEFNNVDKAPKFDFDKSGLEASDREVLAQIARCVTTGPLKGRSLKLVGRADPRGEVEYNMALGEHRAGSAESYLMQLGVNRGSLAETSRGKLDATGTSEAGWELDRRVDIILQ